MKVILGSVFFLVFMGFFIFSYADNQDVPEWVKNNAGWWANGEISDSVFIDGIEFLIKENVIVIYDEIKIIQNFKEYDYEGYSPLFRTFAYEKDLIVVNGNIVPLELQFEFKSSKSENYDEIKIKNNERVAVIIPTFTASAYWEPGFYTFYRGECDQEFHGVLFRNEDCLTIDIIYDKPLGYSGSSNAVKVLELLGYEMISDIHIDKDPNILQSFDKIIVLHNEYVTKKEFDAITSHPKVMFLYPNALYAEINVNYDDDTISLIRGHNYPDPLIRNGFDWEYENTHPYEFDNICKDWSFYNIDYGVMLDCYPENIIFTDELLLKMIREF